MPDLSGLLIDLAAGRTPPPHEIDQSVLDAARDHRMTGLLWTWAEPTLSPGGERSWLARRDLGVQQHHARLTRTLTHCVHQLSEAGIDVATVKGVTAEARWYQRRGERPCSDVDLLVAPHAVHRAGDAVEALQPGHPLRAHIGPLVVAGRLQAVTLNVDGIEVDLHFDLFKLGISTRQSSEIWRRTSDFTLPNDDCVRVLDDTTALVHLLVHLNKDRFQRLLAYADITRVIDGGSVDWELFQRICRCDGLTVPVHCSLETVLDQLGRPWPDPLARPEGPRCVAWRYLWRRSIRLRGTEGRLRFRRRQNWIPVLSQGRTREAALWWLREMWPPRASVEHHYAEIPGPYMWKLVRGRGRALVEQRRLVTEVRHSSSERHGQTRPTTTGVKTS